MVCPGAPECPSAGLAPREEVQGHSDQANSGAHPHGRIAVWKPRAADSAAGARPLTLLCASISVSVASWLREQGAGADNLCLWCQLSSCLGLAQLLDLTRVLRHGPLDTNIGCVHDAADNSLALFLPWLVMETPPRPCTRLAPDDCSCTKLTSAPVPCKEPLSPGAILPGFLQLPHACPLFCGRFVVPFVGTSIPHSSCPSFRAWHKGSSSVLPSWTTPQAFRGSDEVHLLQ